MTDLDNEIAPALIAEEFRELLAELQMKPATLAKRLRDLGDYRSLPAITRSIQRMLSEDTSVSGEMLVIAKLLVRQQRRKERKSKFVKWQHLESGAVETIVWDFTLTLVPKTRGRWLVNVKHHSGYNHQWPGWENNLESAQVKAIEWMEHAENWLDEVQEAAMSSPHPSVL